MATLPEASLTINESASAFAASTGYIVVMACVGTSADGVPRVVSSTQGLLAQYGYSPGVDYCALHFEQTRKPVIFIGMPVTTAGAVGSLDTTGVTGSSAVTVTAASAGIMEQVDAVVTVLNVGTFTIGTDQITLSISLDGGETTVNARLGTATSYTIPNVGIVLNFGVGTLIGGDVFTFRTTAPMWNGTAITNARNALAGQQNGARSWLVVGDMASSALATDVLNEANSYASANERFVYARTQVTDLLPLALKSKVAAETLTFASTGHTITRSVGGFFADGFVNGMTVVITGTASNNTTLVLTNLSDTVMTFASGLVNEGPINSNLVKIVQVETLAAFTSAQTAAFATIDAQKRIDIGYGRGRMVSPITGYAFRRPAAWAASLREYQHDVQIPCWRKDDGPLDNCSLTDDNGNTVEFDERYDGGGLAGRFTCLRSYANGPLGAFVALSLTRDTDGALLSRTHNMAVANLASTVVQTTTENLIGAVLQLNADGTGTDASLALLEQKVNRALQVNLLQNFKEGPRASSAVWTASRTDVLSAPGSTLNGNLALNLNGTLENIATTVTVS